MAIGKNSLSFKKQAFQSDTNIGLGFKDLVCADIMVGGETSIDLTALTAPTSMTSKGFTNPLPAEILDAKILFFKDNVSVIRSAGGLMIPYEEYQITSSSSITLTTPALPQEIFTVVIRNKSSNGMMGVDGRVIRASGILAAGSQDINVGQEFAINAYPASQIGEVMLFIDGQIQFRNVSNATASPSADGNYEEVPVTGGLGSILRMNSTETYARNWLAVSTAVIVQRPDGSRDSALETLAGTVDQVVETLAEVAGVDTTVFQTSPSNVNLLQFGDTVIDHESRITALEPYVTENLSYLRQYNLTVTSSSSGTWTINRAVGVPYKTVDGAWRLRFNFSGYFSVAFALPLFTVSGVTFNSGYDQAISVYASANTWNLGKVNGGTSNVQGRTGTAEQYWNLSGDVELASKPSFVP